MDQHQERPTSSLKIGVGLSLYFRVLVPGAVAILLLALGGSYVSTRVLGFELEKEMVTKGRTFAFFLALRAADIVQNRGPEEIQSNFDEVKNQEGVGFIALTNPNNEILVHTFSPLVPTAFLTELAREKDVNTSRLSGKHLAINGREYLEIDAPILGGELGRIHLGIDLTLARDKQWQAQKAIVVPFTLGAVFILSIFVALVRGPLREIRLLSHAAKDFGGGRRILAADIGLIDTAEVKELAVSLSEMMGAIEKHTENLEKIVEERTASLKAAQIKLVQSSKLSALGEMAGGIAHEINNPLGAIILTVQNLRESLKDVSGLPPEVSQDLERAESLANRISKIVKGLRSSSRGEVNEPFQRASLRDIVNDTLNFCNERFRNHNVTLLVPELPDVYLECQPVELTQVILNLLNNAFDAVEKTPTPWVRLEIEVLPAQVLLRVTDSGKGIPPSVVEKMMQPFFTTKEVGKGTGLGLSISHGIVERHGGRLLYDATSPNTSFVMEIPLTTPRMELEAMNLDGLLGQNS